MRTRFMVFLLGCVILASASCNHSSPTSRGSAERYIDVPNAVGFDIEPLSAEGPASRWLATYTAKGKTARFQIEFDAAQQPDDKNPLSLRIQAGSGRFISEPTSDASVLLADLKIALEAKTLPVKVRRLPELPFKFVSFGDGQSQAAGGGFQPTPPGHWTPSKIFISDGAGEFFLNVNRVIRKGQLSIKDPDYGDLVLAQLAQVL